MRSIKALILIYLLQTFISCHFIGSIESHRYKAYKLDREDDIRLSIYIYERSLSFEDIKSDFHAMNDHLSFFEEFLSKDKFDLVFASHANANDYYLEDEPDEQDELKAFKRAVGEFRIKFFRSLEDYIRNKFKSYVNSPRFIDLTNRYENPTVRMNGLMEETRLVLLEALEKELDYQWGNFPYMEDAEVQFIKDTLNKVNLEDKKKKRFLQKLIQVAQRQKGIFNKIPIKINRLKKNLKKPEAKIKESINKWEKIVGRFKRLHIRYINFKLAFIIKLYGTYKKTLFTEEKSKELFDDFIEVILNYSSELKENINKAGQEIFNFWIMVRLFEKEILKYLRKMEKQKPVNAEIIDSLIKRITNPKIN